ncbi:hypothetical protein Clacol_003423 [Clathrus columnatus]|uniref:Sulfotransferase n=1 Tax=Clathrus columnatus TaxID=1419009 RepID=A0AAV5A9H9_9AGAM|nr:hypothetical protein Clacol_003423 [Clathrus columnatus]
MVGNREHPAPLKVIGLGLGRTGTLSLSTALEILGFGPCHHPFLFGTESDVWSKFAKIAQDNPSPEILDDLFRGYGAALDNTAAILAEPLYRAYPQAKFILTTRDPAKWAQSMKKTIYRVYIKCKERETRIASGKSTKEDLILSERVKRLGLLEWTKVYNEWYHQGRLKTDPEGELERHNRFIRKLIPSEQLLVFNVADGWKPLVEFLGV